MKNGGGTPTKEGNQHKQWITLQQQQQRTIEQQRNHSEKHKIEMKRQNNGIIKQLINPSIIDSLYRSQPV